VLGRIPSEISGCVKNAQKFRSGFGRPSDANGNGVRNRSPFDKNVARVSAALRKRY
jgi:hypothetical protein